MLDCRMLWPCGDAWFPVLPRRAYAACPQHCPCPISLCPVTLSAPGISPVTLHPLHSPCLQLVPAQRGNGAEQEHLNWHLGSCGLWSISDIDVVSGFCKSLPLPGFQSQKQPWFYIFKTRQVYLSPEYILCTSPVLVDVSRHYTKQQFIIKKVWEMLG